MPSLLIFLNYADCAPALSAATPLTKGEQDGMQALHQFGICALWPYRTQQAHIAASSALSRLDASAAAVMCPSNRVQLCCWLARFTLPPSSLSLCSASSHTWCNLLCSLNPFRAVMTHPVCSDPALV